MQESAPASEPYESLLAQTRWLGRLARELVPPADREDLVQDVILVAMRRDAVERPKHLRGWLATVARNLASRRRVRESNRRAREHLVARGEGDVASAAEQVAAFAAHQAVVNAVMELDEPYRRSLLLRFWDDLSTREVALRMGVPVETARTRIKRGVARLRERLDGRSGGREAWVIPLMRVGGVRETIGTGAAGTATPFLTSVGVLGMKKSVMAVILVLALVMTGVAVFGVGPTVDDVDGVATLGPYGGRGSENGTEPGKPDVVDGGRTAMDEQAQKESGRGRISIRVVPKNRFPSDAPVQVTLAKWGVARAGSKDPLVRRQSVTPGSTAVFDSVPHGVYRIHCYSPALGRGAKVLALSTAALSATVDLNYRNDHDFTVTGFKADGTPAAGARVTLVALAESAESGRRVVRSEGVLGRDGIWVGRGLRIDEASVLLQGDDDWMAAKRVVGENSVVLKLRRSGQARVVLEGAQFDSGRLQSSRVEFFLKGAQRRVSLGLRQRVGPTREVRMRLAPGRYAVTHRGSADSGLANTVSSVVAFTVEEGREVGVRLPIDHGRGVRGLVTTRDGRPAEGARVMVVRRGTPAWPIGDRASAEGGVAPETLGVVRDLTSWARSHRGVLGRSHSCEVVRGRYSLVGLVPGIYDLDIHGPGASAPRTTCDLREPGIITSNHVVEPAGSVCGHANSLDGFVELRKRGESSVRFECKIQSAFQLQGVPIGVYAVTAVSRTGARYEMPDVTVRAGEMAFASISPQNLGAEGILEGRVTRGFGGVDGVSVGLGTARHLTGPSGRFEFPAWPHGKSKVFTVTGGGMQWRVRSGIVGRRADIELGSANARLLFSSSDESAARSPEDGELVLRFLDGTVVQNGRGLDFGRRRIKRGVVRLTGLYPGRYSFEAKMDGGGTSRGTFHTDDGDRDFSYHNTVKVSLRVVGADGRPVFGALVRAWSKPGATETTGNLPGYRATGYSVSRRTRRDGQTELALPAGAIWVTAHLPVGWPSSDRETRSTSEEFVVGESSAPDPILLTLR